MRKVILDVMTMSGRCLRMSFRNIEALGEVAVTPLLMVILFIYLLGSGAYDIQTYINTQVPSVILLTLGFSSFYTGYGVNNDMKRGIIDRFRSMPLFQPAVLAGHVASSLVRSFVTVAVVIGSTIVIGFRPQAGMLDWLIILGILFLSVLMTTWISILIGLTAKTSESVASLGAFVQFMPFLSAGFTAPENLITPLRVFFTYQPFTPIINAIRGLTMGAGDKNDIIVAVIWCVVLMLVFYVLSMRIYNRKAQ